MLVSAYQSELFNRYLDARIDDGLVDTPLAGDVLKKTDTGGLFTVDDTPAALDDAAARLDRPRRRRHRPDVRPQGDVAARRARRRPRARRRCWPPKASTPPPSRCWASWPRARAARCWSPSARRRYAPATTPTALVLEFSLPPGAYATVLLAEVTK